MLATEYAQYYKIEAQRDNEGDMEFRGRVATQLREMGHIIEAHEAYHDERYENSDAVGTGIIGVVAQAMQGTNYAGDPIGNDIAAGIVTQSPKEEMSAEMALLSVLMFG